MEICLPCLNLSNNSGSVEMWKLVFIVLIYLITLEVWKCGNVETCLQCLSCLITLEVWKCGNMPFLSLSNNSGRLEVWKCGNMSSVSLSNNSGRVEMWKYVFNVFI